MYPYNKQLLHNYTTGKTRLRKNLTLNDLITLYTGLNDIIKKDKDIKRVKDNLGG